MKMRYCKEYFDDVRLVIDAMPDITSLFNKRICITGATGMLCSAVVDIIALLNKERNAGIKLILAGRNKERVIDRFAGVLSAEEFDFAGFDAVKANSFLPEADFYIHGASNADPAKMSSEPVETMLSNLIGLKTVLDSAKEADGSRVLFVSTGEIYGNKKPESEGCRDKLDNLYKEDDYGYVDILNPRSCYPMSKRAAETMCVSYNREFGVDVVIARSCHSYGPGITESDSRASAVFTKNAAAGKDIVMKSAGEQVRSYCYTLDSASALLTILLHGETAQAYNISNKDSIVTIRYLAETIAKAAGVKVVFENPDDCEKKSYNMMNCSALDSGKLEELGWKPKFGVQDGVEATIKYYDILN